MAISSRLITVEAFDDWVQLPENIDKQFELFGGEVVSAENSSAESASLNIKLGNYLAVGTMVWVVRPESQSIEVYQPATPTKVYRQNETIKLETILPNFVLKLSDVFK